MAASATAHFILTFRTELWQTIEESLEDCSLMGAAVLASGVGTNLSAEAGQATGDATDAIQKAVERVAQKKQSKLRLFMKEMPNLIVERRRGGAHNVKHLWTDKDRECLASKYAELQAIWADAKMIAKEAQKRKSAIRGKSNKHI